MCYIFISLIHTLWFKYSASLDDTSLAFLTLSLLDLMSSSGISVMSSGERSLVRKCSETGGFGDTGWVVNWSAVFVETVFESSFGFTYVFIWSSGCIASCK